MPRGAQQPHSWSVLVIDSDPAIRLLIRRELKAIGFRVQDVEPSEAARSHTLDPLLDLAILDIDAAEIGGPQSIRWVRDQSPVPIVALSLHGDEDATAVALDSGADDFIKKPFGTRELLARIKNALRRRAREQGKPTMLVNGDLTIDLLHRRVRLRDEDVRFSVKPYEVLRALAENAGKVLSNEAILRSVWGEKAVHQVQYLRVAIRQLRHKLEIDPTKPRYIVTEPRVGYRLNAQIWPARQRSPRSLRSSRGIEHRQPIGT